MNSFKTPLVKSYLVSILALLVIILLIPLVIMPQLSKIRTKNLAVRKNQERLEQLNKKMQALADIDEDEESQRLVEVEKAVPSDKKLAPLIIGIRNQAAEAGLRVLGLDFKPGKVATESALPKGAKETNKTQASSLAAKEQNYLTFKLKVEETFVDAWEKLKNFLTSLETTKRLLKVNSIQASLNQSAKTYIFDLEISTPVKPIKSCAGKANDSCPDLAAEPLPAFSQENKKIFDFLAKLKDKTEIVVPTGSTGIEDPFK